MRNRTLVRRALLSRRHAFCACAAALSPQETVPYALDAAIRASTSGYGSRPDVSMRPARARRRTAQVLACASIVRRHDECTGDAETNEVHHGEEDICSQGPEACRPS